MDDRTSSIVVISLGVLILLVSLTADMTGLGTHIGFGSKQIMGAAIGIVVTAIGVDLRAHSSGDNAN